MPRRKQNARGVDKPRKIKTTVIIPKVVFLTLHKQFDDISPGVLVAAAEWRG